MVLIKNVNQRKCGSKRQCRTPQQFQFRSANGSAYYPPLSSLIGGVKENSSRTETITLRSMRHFPKKMLTWFYS